MKDINLQVLSNGGPKKHFACEQLHIKRLSATRQLVDLFLLIYLCVYYYLLIYFYRVRYCVFNHTPFFSRTINISNDQALILNIIGRRLKKNEVELNTMCANVSADLENHRNLTG